MKLYLNKTSPFARWILICALEWGITDLELVWVDPWEVPEALQSVNPFSTVPVLQTPAGQALYESSIIIRHLIPSAVVNNLAALQQFSLGKMLLETAFRYVSWQRYNPADTISHPLIDRTYQTLARVLQTLSVQDLSSMTTSASPDIASLQLAVGLNYLEFRCPDLIANCVAQPLLERLMIYQARPSFRCTTPSALAYHPQSVLNLCFS